MKQYHHIKVNENVIIGNDLPIVLISGPCQLENRKHALDMATSLIDIAKELDIPFIFKTSYDKANRSSIKSKRGIGLEKALPVFKEIKDRLGCPILTDVHTEAQCEPVAKVVDILQIPAFLCRQTDLIVSVAKTGKIVNVKKGQFLSPLEITNVIKKIEGFENERFSKQGKTRTGQNIHDGGSGRLFGGRGCQPDGYKKSGRDRFSVFI